MSFSTLTRSVHGGAEGPSRPGSGQGRRGGGLPSLDPVNDSAGWPRFLAWKRLLDLNLVNGGVAARAPSKGEAEEGPPAFDWAKAAWRRADWRWGHRACRNPLRLPATTLDEDAIGGLGNGLSYGRPIPSLAVATRSSSSAMSGAYSR